MSTARRQIAAIDTLFWRLDNLLEEARKRGFEVKVQDNGLERRIELIAHLDNCSEGYNIEVKSGRLQSVRELTIWVPADQMLALVDESEWRYTNRKRSLRYVEERIGVT